MNICQHCQQWQVFPASSLLKKNPFCLSLSDAWHLTADWKAFFKKKKSNNPIKSKRNQWCHFSTYLILLVRILPAYCIPVSAMYILRISLVPWKQTDNKIQRPSCCAKKQKIPTWISQNDKSLLLDISSLMYNDRFIKAKRASIFQSTDMSQLKTTVLYIGWIVVVFS